jgi:hypothetical protein
MERYAGLSNPSTIAVADEKSFRAGITPKSALIVKSSWSPGQQVTGTRTTSPGIIPETKISVSEVTFDMESGTEMKTEVDEKLTAGEDGLLQILGTRAEGVLLESHSPEK